MTLIDYSKYSEDDLLDAKSNIDKDANPDNYQALMYEIEIRGKDVKEYIEEQEKNELKGLGGWLLLIGLGVVISPFRMAYGFGPIYYSIFTDGTWEILTTAGTEAYHPMWAPLLIGEAIYNSLMVVLSIYMIYLFFSKHYLFPKFYIALVLVSLIFIPLDAWFGSNILVNEPMFDPETTKEFARTLVSVVIWVPYLLISERVKLTFVKK